jgi:hypothetical protein
LHDGLIVGTVVESLELFDDFPKNIEPRAISIPQIVIGEQFCKYLESGCLGFDGLEEDYEVSDVIAFDG